MEASGECSRLQPEDLERIRPGLAGYLNDYLERLNLDQEALWGEQNPLNLEKVRLTLDLLSCAMGPLRLDDLQHLAPTGTALRSHDITNALGYLGRLVIGDGQQQGFVFSHSLLGDYF